MYSSMNDEESDENINTKNYCVTSDLMSKTDPRSVFMHCLPAKVGLEVSEEVFRSEKSIVWRQAYNRMVAQKNLSAYLSIIIVLTKTCFNINFYDQTFSYYFWFIYGWLQC